MSRDETDTLILKFTTQIMGFVQQATKYSSWYRAWFWGFHNYRSSPREVLLGKDILKICNKLYSRTPVPKCDFNKVTLELYCNHTLAWVFSCNFCCVFWERLFIRAPLLGCLCTILFHGTLNILFLHFDRT